MSLVEDTIVAIATPLGRGGVAVVRVSGPLVVDLINLHIDKAVARHCYYLKLRNKQSEVLDDGLLIYFPAPNSYTGEDVLEFHGHGNPVLTQAIVDYFVGLGCRQALPGEFTKRAFLQDKLDLIQAQAVMDIITAQSDFAARAAMRNLQGEFSKAIKSIEANIANCRMWLESAIDFSDQEIDEQDDRHYSQQISNIYKDLVLLLKRAKVGRRVLQSFSVVLVGPPNVGKSSLFNYLCNKDAAIVDSQAGTTRDILEQPLVIGGVACTLLDTAGLHHTENSVEKAGINKAINSIETADLIILMADASKHDLADMHDFWQKNLNKTLPESRMLIVWNKVDLVEKTENDKGGICVSVKNKIGLELLSKAILDKVGIDTELLTEMIPAQQRHLALLEDALAAIVIAKTEMKNNSLDIVAENLKLAHMALADIYGNSHHDAILDKIFFSFCIGK